MGHHQQLSVRNAFYEKQKFSSRTRANTKKNGIKLAEKRIAIESGAGSSEHVFVYEMRWLVWFYIIQQN